MSKTDKEASRRRNMNNKRKGRDVENLVLSELIKVFPMMKRMGSTAYHKAAPDLRQDGTLGLPPIRIVAMRAPRREPIVCLRISDFERLFRLRGLAMNGSAVVQVKARKVVAVEKLLSDLEDATSG